MNTHFLTNSLKNNVLIGLLLFTFPLFLANASSTDDHKTVAKDVHVGEHNDEAFNKHEDEHGDEHAEEGHIEISAKMINTVGITASAATHGVINQRLTLYGTSTTEPSRVSHVHARFPGIITMLDVNVGDQVKKGQLIAEVESNNSLVRYNIHAAISGTVTQRHANAGELANEQILITIEDHQKLWVELQVFSSQKPKLSVGQTVRISNEEKFTHSTISQLLPTTNNSPFTIARVPLDNVKGHWSVGSLLSGSVVINKQSVALVIDNMAIQTMEDKTVIFVKNEHGFEAREISLGLSDNQFSQVLSGLNSGDVYGIKNSYLLKAELEKSSAEHHH
jgi:cobalt-zinc-cadmium efflux system membrane fusion protein